MKKLLFSFAVLAVATVGIFTSCDTTENDLPPVVTVGIDSINAFVGDTISFTASLSSENTLASFQSMSSDASISFLEGSSETFSAVGNASVKVTLVVGSSAEVGSDITITCVVSDEAATSSAKVVISVLSSSTPLSEAAAFEWKRVGGNDATGLEEFGLTWSSNTATSAVIKKGADKFVVLDAAIWSSLASVEDLVYAIDAADDVESWTEISVTASATYDYLLGTINGGTYYMIHVTNSSVTVASEGTTVVISGEYKK